jgi:hypothetical protein
MNWDNWLYGIKTPTGPFMMDIRSNYISQANTNHPTNTLWDPARDGWRLAHWMTTPPDAPVGLGFALRTNQLALTNLFSGVPVRLSSFTTNFVTVNYAFQDGGGAPLAAGALTFAPGETLKRIYPAGFDLSAQNTVLLVLNDAVRGDLTGRTNVLFTGNVPAPLLSFWAGTNTLPSYRLSEGMLVKLNPPAAHVVRVRYSYSAGALLKSGELTFAPGETVQWIDPTGIDPAAYELIQLTLNDPAGAGVTGFPVISYGTPPVQVSLGVASSQLDLATFSSGVPVGLNRASTNVVSVDFTVEGDGGTLTNGTLVFTPGQAALLLTLPTVNPSQHDLLRVSLANAQQAQLVAPSQVYYVRVVAGQGPLLVTSGSIWKYLDTGVDASTAWRLLGYNDSAWLSGCAQLGYGDSDECTVVSYGPNSSSKYVTTYFRQKFVVSDPGVFINLAMWLLRDDGGVVYLNGTEVYRSPSMPAGTITYLTLANAQGSSAPLDNTVDQANLTPARLVAGTNIAAVEIHQHRGDSSDASFDFALTGQPTPPPPPQHLYWGDFGGQPVLAWGDPTFAVQLSDKVTGPWTNVVGAVSPFYVIPGPGNAFYRLRK